MKDLKIYIILISVLMVVYIVIQYNRPKVIDWSQTFSNNDKIPFGTYILFNRLHDIFPNANVQTYREPVYNVVNDHSNQHGTYIIICHDAGINEYDYNKLQKFVKAGNDVFIAASGFGPYINKMLKIKTSADLLILSNHDHPVRFLNKHIDTAEYYNIDKKISDDCFVEFDTTRAVMLGENGNHRPNFIKYNMGKGSIYFNASPMLFTNYGVLQPKGPNYAAIALSHLKNTGNILWDEYYTRGRRGEESLMRVFLRDPMLKNAFYIALFSLLAFVLYEVKRRQRIIPIIEPLSNTSVDFAKVVGQVYYEQRDNRNIAQKKMLYFLEFVRTQYYLKTNQFDDDFTKSLVQKSGVELQLVQKLIWQFISIHNGQHVSDKELIEFNRNIEQFYTQSR